jgi:hypothetical protein
MSGQENAGEQQTETKYECQFCGRFDDTIGEHEEHVERMHYAELLRESEVVGR